MRWNSHCAATNAAHASAGREIRSRGSPTAVHASTVIGATTIVSTECSTMCPGVIRVPSFR